MYYRLGTARYALVTTDRGLVLRKAGAQGPRVGDTKVENGVTYRLNQHSRWERVENAAAPGQMSLFGGLPTIQDEPSRNQQQNQIDSQIQPFPPVLDEDGDVDLYETAVKGLEIYENKLKSQVNHSVLQHKQKMDGMTLKELEAHDYESEFESYFYDNVETLGSQIGSAIGIESNNNFEGDFVDACSDSEPIDDFFQNCLSELDNHREKQIEARESQIDSVIDENHNEFQSFVDEAVENVESLQDWASVKESINKQYENAVQDLTKKITQLSGDGPGDAVNVLAEIRDSGLSQYSDDEWDDLDESEDVDPSDIGDEYYDRFIDLANEVDVNGSKEQAILLYKKHYSDVLQNGRTAIMNAFGTKAHIDEFEENMSDAYNAFVNFEN